ncbi:hypothetical protein [Nocardiopsis sp. L17-MgMaSL7]|uniref:hypothetical protein n=1 Tax=Nocardiopsis sp. L17-MgMaSL7 TaxID=1938893 RepID=UPI0011B4F82F|nr:hypothetical protein [Nocardiopsis sp. L17-MgMaSL7]
MSLLLLTLVSGCTGPTPSDSLYRDAAEQTVTDLLSAVGTGIMLSEIHRRDMALPPYTETTVEDAEDAARSVNDTFGTRQPPTARARSLRSELAPLCDTAVNALADLRIALREDDQNAVEAAERSLRSVSLDLTDLRGRLS